MSRPLAWTLAAATAALLIAEAALLLRPLPPPPPPPFDLIESIRALEGRSAGLEEAYERLEEELGRYLRRAPTPTLGLAAGAIVDELARLRREIAAIQEIVAADPERALAIPSMRLDLEKALIRLEEAEAAGERLRSEAGARERTLLYFLLGNGLLILVVLIRLGTGPWKRTPEPRAGAIPGGR